MIPEMTSELSNSQYCANKGQFRCLVIYAKDIIYKSAYSICKIYMLSSIVVFDAQLISSDMRIQIYKKL